MQSENSNSEWILRIPKSRAKNILVVMLFVAVPLLMIRGCQLVFTYPGTMITSELLAPEYRGEPWGINYVARTIAVRANEFLRIVRFRWAKESDTRDIYFQFPSFKWLSGRHLLICKVGGNTRDARGDEFTETWHELKISYRLDFLDYTDLEKVCPLHR